MKARALILFFPFAVFLIETVSFPSQVNNICKKVVNPCEKMSCMQMKKPMNCQDKKSDNEKPSGRCNNNPDCTFCPVCYTFTFQPQYQWSPKFFSFKKNYRLVNTGYVSSYISLIWKPPDSYLLDS
jgi:hypothetical protein